MGRFYSMARDDTQVLAVQRRRKGASAQVGAITVEAAVILPLFLLVVFFVITIGLMLNARTAIRLATTNGSRLAYTRGATELVGPNVRFGNMARDWILNQAPAAPSGANAPLLPLLATPGMQSKAFGPTGWYMTQWNAVLGAGGNPQVVPERYVLALVYAHAELLQSIGGVQFPCDPRGPTATNDGPGCARCLNLNASSRDRCLSGLHWDGQACVSTPIPISGGGLRQPQGAPGVNILSASYSREFVGLYCEYAPSDLLITSIYNLISILTAGNASRPTFISESRGYFDGSKSDIIEFN